MTKKRRPKKTKQWQDYCVDCLRPVEFKPMWTDSKGLTHDWRPFDPDGKPHVCKKPIDSGQ